MKQKTSWSVFRAVRASRETVHFKSLIDSQTLAYKILNRRKKEKNG
jgi:hypothetical protein